MRERDSRQELNVKDLFHACAELQMAGDRTRFQIDHPQPAAQLVALGHDGHPFQRRPSLGETDEGEPAVERQPPAVVAQVPHPAAQEKAAKFDSVVCLLEEIPVLYSASAAITSS